MKKLFEKIRSWNTTKKSFWFAVGFMLIYVAINMTLNWLDKSVDDTLTSETFETIRLIITAGGFLTGAKIAKGK